MPFNGWLAESAIAATAVAVPSVCHWLLCRLSLSSSPVTAMGRHPLLRAARMTLFEILAETFRPEPGGTRHDFLARERVRDDYPQPPDRMLSAPLD